MVLPLLFSATLAVAGSLAAWNAVKVAAGLACAIVALAAWPVRAAMRRYGRGLRDARVRP